MNNNFMPEKFLDLQQTMAKNLFKNIFHIPINLGLQSFLIH